MGFAHGADSGMEQPYILVLLERDACVIVASIALVSAR